MNIQVTVEVKSGSHVALALLEIAKRIEVHSAHVEDPLCGHVFDKDGNSVGSMDFQVVDSTDEEND